MILDKQLEFSDGQAVTSTAISANVVDLGATPTLRDLGAGGPIWLVVQTRTAATDTSSDATLTVTLESAENEALSNNPVVHFSTGALAFASFSPAGTRVAMVALPLADYKRYLGVRYTVASGPLTAGNFDAFLTRDPQAWRAYPNGPVV